MNAARPKHFSENNISWEKISETVNAKRRVSPTKTEPGPMEINMAEAYIVAAVRTAGGRRNGRLRDIHSADLGAIVLNAPLDRTGIDPAAIEEFHPACPDPWNHRDSRRSPDHARRTAFYHRSRSETSRHKNQRYRPLRGE
jgi:hypothetical protein